MIMKYLNTFLISFVILLIIIQYGLFAYFYYVKGFKSDNINQVQEVVETFENDSNEKEKLSEFYVEIKGAVNSPGVFKVTSDNIINDVINMAGGLKNNAYTKNINLSKNVSKEMVVYVYTNYEYSLLNTKEETYECNCPKQDISVCTDKGTSIITSDEDKPEEHFNSDSKSETENNKTKSISSAYSGQYHTVKPGQTLYDISMSYYGTSEMVDEIKDRNNIDDDYTIKEGQKILLP